MAPVDARKDVTTGVVTAAIAVAVVVIAEAIVALLKIATNHSNFQESNFNF